MLTLLIILASYFLLYYVIKMAVKHGINESRLVTEKKMIAQSKSNAVIEAEE